MTVSEILGWAKYYNVRFTVKDNALSWTANKRAVSPAVLAAIRDHKSELIAIIQAQEIEAAPIVAALQEFQQQPEFRTIAELAAEEGWTGELGDLIAWAWTADLPNLPFTLRGKQIEQPKAWYKALLIRCNYGPGQSQEALDELYADLKALQETV